MKLIHTYKRVLARNDALHSLYYPIQYLHTLHCKVKCVLSRFAEKQIHYVTQYIENYRMNGNLDNASADSTIGRNKKSFQVSQNGNYREGRPNLRSSSSNALRRMSNTIITQPRFRRRPNKLNNGLTSTKSSPSRILANVGVSYRLDFHKDFISAEEIQSKALKKEERSLNKTLKKNMLLIVHTSKSILCQHLVKI